LESDTSLSCDTELDTVQESYVFIPFVSVSFKDAVASDLKSVASKSVVGI
jgi:hypothetical protein